MIVTFYSYKGGVGRSMALANVARWFELQGLKVVMVDWDLEAPGLESFFSATVSRESVRAKLGLVDLLLTYREIFPNLPKPQPTPAPSAQIESASPAADEAAFVNVLKDTLPPLSHTLIPIASSDCGSGSGGGLWLLSAGCRNEERFGKYAETVQQFSWSEFYAQFEGEAFFEWMRLQLDDPAFADVTLIDSRTGVAEMTGVCTRQLADVVVTLCAPNDQNLDGVAEMARSFVRPDLLKARGGRALLQIMVPARIDLSEGRPVDLFEERFHANLDGYLPDAFTRVDTNFGKLRIPYISAYAYSERLAIGSPDGVKTLQEAYEALALHIALLASPEGELKQKCSQALQRTFRLPTAYVCGMDAEVRARLPELKARLEHAGMLALELQISRSEDTLPADILDPGKRAALVLLFSSSSDRLRELWRRARAEGLPIYLVTPNADTQVPRGFGGVRVLDLQQNFDELLRLLQSAERPARVPFLAPPAPPGFAGRAAELREIKSLLRGKDGPRGSASVALIGAPGLGKSALARIVCHDDDIVDTFKDGLLWATMGERPDVREILAKLVVAFEGESNRRLDLDEAERRLAEHLSRRRCLLVLDDVWETEHLRRIPRAGQGFSLLITTRSKDVGVAARSTCIELRPLEKTVASTLLTAGMPAGSIDDEGASRIVTLLGNSPLALQLANSVLQVRIKDGGDPRRALEMLQHELENEGIGALGAEADMAMSRAFAASIERLEASDRARLPLLAAMPSNDLVPLEEMTKAGITDAPQMAQRLAALSLLDFDPTAGTVRIQALTHVFFKSLEQRERRSQQTRVATQQEAGRKIYISYRRADSAAYAGRIFDRLSEHFGPESVFMDVSSISAGEDFRAAVAHAIGSAEVVVAVIGRNWLMESDGSDFVRLELEEAIRRKIRTIPVLVDGARMPTTHELGGAIAHLALLHTLEVSDVQFNQDIDRLIASIQHDVRFTPNLRAAAPASPWRKRRLLIAALVLVALVAGGAIVGQSARKGPAIPAKADEFFAQGEDYYFGRSGSPNFELAVQAYRHAADLGYAPAQNALGRMYEAGKGVQQSQSDAISWYKRAAEQGHPDAIAALRRLAPAAK